MKIIYNKYIPFKGFIAINLFGVIFVRSGAKIDRYVINHEQIHTQQMKELAYIFFYIIYVLEWIWRLFQNRFNNKEAYKNILFEREAKYNESDLSYLSSRKPYAMWKTMGL